MGSSFLVSQNELTFSKEAGEQFYLHEVFQFKERPRLCMLSGDMSQHVQLKLTDYQASFRRSGLVR